MPLKWNKHFSDRNLYLGAKSLAKNIGCRDKRDAKNDDSCYPHREV